MNKLQKQIYLFYLYRGLIAASFSGAVLIPFFTDYGGLSLFQVYLLQTWFMVVFFLAEIPTGLVADRIGYKRSLQYASVFVTIGVLVYGLSGSLLGFVIAEAIYGIGAAFFSGADQAWLYEILSEKGREEEMRSIYGRSTSIKLVSILAGGLIGSYIAKHIGLAATMYLSAIPYGLSLIAASLLWKERRATASTDEASIGIQSIIKTARKLQDNPTLKLFAINSVLLSTLGSIVIWLYQSILQDIGISIEYYGYFQAALLLPQGIVSGKLC